MNAPVKFLPIVLAAASAISWLRAEDKADLAAVHRIRSEAFENSKVMEHMFYLTDVNGPRLTGSPGFRAAADWALGRLREYGLSNAKLEKWGPFGRGWTCTHFEAHLIEPGYAPLIGIPLAWTAGTDGTITAEPVMAVIHKDEDMEKYRGKLRGKIVLSEPPRDVALRTTPLGRRFTDTDLAETAQAPDPATPPAFGPRAPRAPGTLTPDEQRKFRERVSEFLKKEGALLSLSSGYNGDGGTVFATSGGPYDAAKPIAITAVALTPEHYNRIVRLVEHKIPVSLRFDIRNRFFEENLDSTNIVAEIPGNAKKDELVMLGAHFDSWHGGTGATDNAAGSSVVMEAARILKALDFKMDRTVRLVLWSGEEQGLLGSKAYVKEHFADPETMKLTGEHAKVSGYFNYDNGTGKIRGIYLQGNDMERPIFEAWMAPFQDLGATTISIRKTGGTDHLSFDAVGLPGFQFIQDPVEYNTRTHHSNMDVYDHIQPGDLMQASAVMASFVYHTAVREAMLPRAPLPKPRPKEEEKKEDKDQKKVPVATQ